MVRKKSWILFTSSGRGSELRKEKLAHWAKKSIQNFTLLFTYGLISFMDYFLREHLVAWSRKQCMKWLNQQQPRRSAGTRHVTSGRQVSDRKWELWEMRSGQQNLESRLLFIWKCRRSTQTSLFSQTEFVNSIISDLLNKERHSPFFY